MTILRDEDDWLELPLPATRLALEAQTTPELIRQARQYAQTRAPLVRRAGRPVSKTYACELVDDAHTDTWTGDLPWDPSQCSLLEHLCQAIKRRTWLEIRHGRRVSLVSLHGSATDGTMSRQLEHALAQVTQGRAGRSPCARLAPRSATKCGAWFSTIPRPPPLLRCWETGCVAREEALERSGLSKRAYEGARKRLLYLSRYLTPALRESAQDCLESLMSDRWTSPTVDHNRPSVEVKTVDEVASRTTRARRYRSRPRRL